MLYYVINKEELCYTYKDCKLGTYNVFVIYLSY